MKNNVNYVIQGILAIAVIILFVMYFSGKKSNTPAMRSATAESGEQIAGFPVAYINVDSLLLKYNFSIDLNEQILKKQENARANYTQKARSLQSEAEEFQYKLQNGAFATRERAEQQQEWQELDSRLTQELMEQTQAMNEQLRDTVVHYLKQYNQGKGYQIIFSNTAGSPIFLADDAYNITNEIVEYLNKRYSGAK